MIKIGPIKTEQPKRRNANLSLAVAGGAVAGALSRYAIPTKKEMSNMFSKEGFDTFIKNESTKARGEKRSILAFSLVGAAIAGGINAIINSNKSKKQENLDNIQYTKLGALIDAPDYACEVMWYGD